MKVGVLALQGAYASHLQTFASLGVEVLEVRTPEDLEKIDRLVIPGGESTTISMLLDSNGMRVPIQESISEGMPVFGTCAGMIVLAREVLDGRDDQKPLGAIDITVRRNAFGRQVDSFESEIEVSGLDEPFPSVFIRAPIVESIGEGVEVYARVDEKIVLCGTDSILVASFHPELSNDGRIHEMFLSLEPSGSQR
ncbi:MAG: pyridoxal 5'-phosphate synthase glutaminase subunit PdxT [Acidimicrobiaceae bacterium]|nr:pyridoxal 5'-phosphate synthase glutaminase subunit PdxT [Acidimicrobiaceae bacterium]